MCETRGQNGCSQGLAIDFTCPSRIPVKKGKTLEAPGSVSGDVELEQLLMSLVLLSFSKLVVDHAFACLPSPVERPGMDAARSNLADRPSLPSPLRFPRADFVMRDAIVRTAFPSVCPMFGCPSVPSLGASTPEGVCALVRFSKAAENQSESAVNVGKWKLMPLPPTPGLLGSQRNNVRMADELPAC